MNSSCCNSNVVPGPLGGPLLHVSDAFHVNFLTWRTKTARFERKIAFKAGSRPEDRHRHRSRSPRSGLNTRRISSALCAIGRYKHPGTELGHLRWLSLHNIILRSPLAIRYIILLYKCLSYFHTIVIQYCVACRIVVYSQFLLSLLAL